MSEAPRERKQGLTREDENWTGCPTKERSPEWSGCELPLWGCLVLSPRREESSIASRISAALAVIVCFSSIAESELILLKDKKELVELASSKSSTVSTELR